MHGKFDTQLSGKDGVRFLLADLLLQLKSFCPGLRCADLGKQRALLGRLVEFPTFENYPPLPFNVSTQIVCVDFDVEKGLQAPCKAPSKTEC
jgi:hypothetical protein